MRSQLVLGLVQLVSDLLQLLLLRSSSFDGVWDSWLLALIAPTFREVRSQLVLGPVQLVSVLSSSSFVGVVALF